VGIYRSRPGGAILGCNPAFAEMFGFDSAEQAVGTQGDELFASTDERRVQNQRLAEKGVVRNVEKKLRRRDGEPIWVLANATYLEDEESGEPAIYGTMIDITDRKRAQQRYRRLFEQGLAAVFRSEHEDPARILECNRAFADLFGFGSPDSTGSRRSQTLS
jgi:PAS domain S-box-containing protein